MATFTSYQHTLPDPNNPIGEGGQTVGSAGPGFSSVKLASEHKIMNTRTNSGRLVSRELSGHKWNIDLSKSYFLGDSIVDVECAKNANVSFILVRRKHNQDVEYLKVSLEINEKKRFIQKINKIYD